PGAELREEAGSAPRAGAALATTRGSRPEARFLHTRRRLAEGRARAVRTRDSLRRHVATAGDPRSRCHTPHARRARLRDGRPLTAALGAARVHALVRAARRGDHARRVARPGRRTVRVWVDMTASAHPLVFRP